MEIDLCAIAPADWEIKSISDVCQRITSGGTPSRREPSYYDGGVWPWVKTQELQDCWIDDTDEHITEAAVAASSAKALPANTILLAMYGATVGQLGILRRSMTCNQACCALITDPDKANFRFLYFQLLQVRSKLKNLATGAAQQNLSGAVIKTLRLPFPPIEEQRAIAHILGTLDDKIELNRKENATLEEMARALFKAWFVDFEPVRAKMEGRWQRGQSLPGLPAHLYDLFPDRLIESELGEIPEGWEVGSLSDFASFQNGYAFKTRDWTDSGHPVVKIGNVKPGIIEISGCSYVAYETVKGLDKFSLKRGDLLVGMTGYVGETGLVPALESVAYLNQRVGRISTANGINDLGYPYCLVRDPAFKAYAESKAHGSAQANVSGKDLMDYPAVLPRSKVLEVFNVQVAKIIGALLSSHEESQNLAQLRDTLLPKLISGELRVPDAEKFVEKSL